MHGERPLRQTLSKDLHSKHKYNYSTVILMHTFYYIKIRQWSDTIKRLLMEYCYVKFLITEDVKSLQLIFSSKRINGNINYSLT